MFRFSLKWILAAMVYAAIAAAAFSQQSWVYADLLCVISLLALGYAVMLIIYARGARQAAAAGFAVLMILLAACLLFAPESVPTQRILIAAGVGHSPILPNPATQPTAYFAGSGTLATSTINSTPVLQTYSAMPSSGWSLVPSTGGTLSIAGTLADITPKLRAANAVATMIVGLLGCLLGVLAFRRAGRVEPTSTPRIAA